VRVPDPLEQLARLYGVQSSYTDASGRRRRAGRASLVAVLRAMGAAIESSRDAVEALRSRREELAAEILEPVTVAWDGEPTPVPVRVPQRMADRRIHGRAVLEDGTELPVTFVPFRSRPGRGNSATVEQRLRWDGARLPPGYHRLVLHVGRKEASSLVIAAPRRQAGPPGGPAWGAFLPLYALRSNRNWGIGDLTDLGELAAWVGRLGGSLVATLPVLAAFLDRPFEPSPYSSASRLFWNELYVDPEGAAEFERCPEARALVRSTAFRRAVDGLRSDPLVDYERAMSLKHEVLDALARTFFDDGGDGRGSFRRFLRDNPAVEEYATFRAIGRRHGKPFGLWPEAVGGGKLPRRRADDRARRYHLYVQWLASEQMAAVAGRAAEAGAGLYFDFPVGVNPDGYDVWRERDAFLLGASAGAPPDPLFTGGQDWGFPPLHPEAIRRQEYRYLIACFRHLMRHATVFRVDHVMGLHRMYVVPHGFGPLQGAYVRYRPEELYAVLALEARRNGTVVVGEDLGIVPSFIRQALARHGVYRSYVLQMELSADPAGGISPPPAAALASLNTHDMPPFSSFWNDADVGLRIEQGWLTKAEAEQERRKRRRIRSSLVAQLQREGRLGDMGKAGGREAGGTERRVLEACIGHLADGPARLLVVNLEDLWLEDRPQNVPGTRDQYPNWRRKARYSVEEIEALPSVAGTLKDIESRRPRARAR
jgi:4-alpha-glucanotransferase